MNQDPQPGDLIEISRPFYQHWAVYVGNGYVVHLTPTDGAVGNSLASTNTKKALVKKDRLLDACGRHQWKVNNKYDKSHPPKNVEDIVRTALSYVGEEVAYNVLSRNCEHFATLVRYDQPDSQQAFGVVTLASLSSIAAGVFLIMLSLLRS
ncbi:hypothetical protein JRQ81_018854 [Phrynocephalus forsythii]|uniref:LRAT domain-containing protein n=1 Tax=Phrynocephalus forsythii TaxID=171643 RepID=A0A9Q0XPC6_9SAUR|nr:hypothetical protein JRQ81_018854 [Phrynocephalus forsythii]